jgi:hypothetical protein
MALVVVLLLVVVRRVQPHLGSPVPSVPELQSPLVMTMMRWIMLLLLQLLASRMR